MHTVIIKKEIKTSNIYNAKEPTIDVECAEGKDPEIIVVNDEK